MTNKRRCRADLIRSHQIASRLGLAAYAQEAGISESTLRKMLRGDEVSLLSISTVAKHLGIMPDALIQESPSPTPSPGPSPRHELRLEFVLECSARTISEVRRTPDTIAEALQALAIPGLTVLHHSTQIRVVTTQDVHVRIPIRLEAVTSRNSSSRPHPVYYAFVKPTVFEKFLERVVWQSLTLRDVTTFGEIIPWGDRRIRFSDDSSLLSLFSGQTLTLSEPEGLLCFSFSIVGSSAQVTDAPQVIKQCSIDFDHPSIRRAFLESLQHDISAVEAASTSRPPWNS